MDPNRLAHLRAYFAKNNDKKKGIANEPSSKSSFGLAKGLKSGLKSDLKSEFTSKSSSFSKLKNLFK